MKFVLITFCLVQLVFTQEPLDIKELGQFSDVERRCINKLSLDENMITQALKQLYMPEDNPKFNDFMECTWRKDGFIDEDGNIIIQSFFFYVQGAYMDAVGIRELAEAFATDTITHCKGVQGTTPGQTGVKLMNCILRRLYT